MAKDPAFLFYPGDWLGGTMGMNLEEKGAYIHLLMFQFNHGPFSEEKARNVLREKPSLWDDIKLKFIKNDKGLFYNVRLEQEKQRRIAYTESRKQSRIKSDEDNVRIYIVRDNVRGTYKIGSSVNPVRRYNELSNQKSPAIMEDEQGKRDISLIWYSEPVERKEESRLHKHFLSKNLNGEWFQLTDLDLKYIYSKYKGTMYRTTQRTENENEIVIENEIEIEDRIDAAFDEIYLDAQKMKWPHLNFDFQFNTFCEKVRGSPGHYKSHDTGGLRLAFQKQLREAKNGTSKNGKQTSRDLAAALQERIMQDAIKQQPGGSG